MIRRPPRSTLSSSSAASDVYKRQVRAPRRALLLGHVSLQDGEAMLQASVDASGEIKPLFTVQDLATGAAVMCDRRYIGLETLTDWMLTKLPYYNRKLVQAHRLDRLEDARRCSCEDVMPSFYTTVMRWDMPRTYSNLQRSCKNGRGRQYHVRHAIPCHVACEC